MTPLTMAMMMLPMPLMMAMMVRPMVRSADWSCEGVSWTVGGGEEDVGLECLHKRQRHPL